MRVEFDTGPLALASKATSDANAAQGTVCDAPSSIIRAHSAEDFPAALKAIAKA